MNTQHKDIAHGRWQALSLTEQLANIGSEVERALNWRKKANEEYSNLALERALELLDFTLDDRKNNERLREVARVREGLVDYFWGENTQAASDAAWRKYFFAFTYAARLRQGR